MRHDAQLERDLFEPIIEIIEGFGYRWVWSAYHTIAVVPRESVRSGQFVFAISSQGDEWYLLLQDKEARLAQIYEIGGRDEAVRLISHALETHHNPSEPLNLTRDHKGAFDLVAKSFGEFAKKQIDRQTESLQRFGWHALTREEQSQILSKVNVEFLYHTTGVLPTPSMTWDVSPYFEQADLFENALEPELADKMLMAFRECLRPGDYLYVMVHDTTSYRFFPHTAIPGAYREYWAVSPAAVSDTSYFLFPDFMSGLIVSWRGTICAFGRQFLGSITKLAPTLLTNSKCEVTQMNWVGS